MKKHKILFNLFLAFFLICFLCGSANSQPNRCPPRCQSGNEETSIHGEVIEIDHPVTMIKTEDNKVYTLRLGPWWYWKFNGWKLEVGDKVEVTGYIQGDLLFPSIIQLNGQQIRLRDKNGVPCWRGMHRQFNTNN